MNVLTATRIILFLSRISLIVLIFGIVFNILNWLIDEAIFLILTILVYTWFTLYVKESYEKLIQMELLKSAPMAIATCKALMKVNSKALKVYKEVIE